MKYGNHIIRSLEKVIPKAVAEQKVLILYGARRVGKTTLIRRYARELGDAALLVTGEDIAVRQYLSSESIEALKAFVGNKRTLIVDEAQYIPNIGLNLKLLVDHIEGLKIIATGSSCFDLARKTGHPLTGRQRTLTVYPLAQKEIGAQETAHETVARLEQRLIYGSYPEVVLSEGDEERARYLRELAGGYLFKDILELEGVRHSDKLLRLLQLLAFQVGHDVSIDSLGQQLGMGKNTVARYLDLLEQSFVIYHRMGLSRNHHKEISKSRRYYFFDNGIRNAVINNFSPITLRDDVGALWENYMCAERLKRNADGGVQSYFWRTYDQQEIDLVEEKNGKLSAYEMKWSPRDVRIPAAWNKLYPKATFDVICRENYLSFI